MVDVEQVEHIVTIVNSLCDQIEQLIQIKGQKDAVLPKHTGIIDAKKQLPNLLKITLDKTLRNKIESTLKRIDSLHPQIVHYLRS